MTPKSAETEPLIKETPDLEANSPGPKTRGYARALLVAVGVASLVLGGAVVAGVVKTGAEVFPPSDWLECDWAEYGRQNPDVVSTFGNDLAKMKYHYETWGWYEVRTCPPLSCDWEEYGRQNPGVVSVYGNDPANLKMHYFEYGQIEGRYCPVNSGATSLAACLSGNYCAAELNPSAPPAGHFCHPSVIGSKFTFLATGMYTGTCDIPCDIPGDDWCGSGTFTSNLIYMNFAGGHQGQGKMTGHPGGKITITWTSLNGAQWTRDTPCY